MAVNHRPKSNGSILFGVTYDFIEASYPDEVTEIFDYYLDGDRVAMITVVYTDNTKCFISTVERTV